MRHPQEDCQLVADLVKHAYALETEDPYLADRTWALAEAIAGRHGLTVRIRDLRPRRHGLGIHSMTDTLWTVAGIDISITLLGQRDPFDLVFLHQVPENGRPPQYGHQSDLMKRHGRTSSRTPSSSATSF